jgi:hypothetical protein
MWLGLGQRPKNGPPSHTAGAHFAGPLSDRILPEEIVDHVDDFATIDVHQQCIIVIADPFVRTIGRREAVLPWIIDPIIAAVEQAIKYKSHA